MSSITNWFIREENEKAVSSSAMVPMRIFQMREELNRIFTSSIPQKAKIWILTEKFKKMSLEDQAIVLMWFSLGVRSDTYLAGEEEDITYDIENELVCFYVRKDKIVNVEGRWIVIACSCGSRKAKGMCLIHDLPRVSLPIDKKRLNYLCKELEISMHSMRRALAVAL
jgi:hypothetical protein